MAYGIEVKNTDNRIVFSSEENYPGLIASSATSLAGFGNTIPTVSTGESILARPQDNESGVIGKDPVDISKFFGSTTYFQTFGGADGVKYRTLTRSTTLTPTTTGYGVEVYNSSGQVLFTSETSNRPELLCAGQTEEEILPGEFVYTCPTGVPFNEVYIELLPLYTVQSTFLNYIDGMYAYFDNTAKKIYVRRVSWRVPGNFSAFTEQTYWNQEIGDSVNVWPRRTFFNSSRSFFIYRVRI